MSSNNFIDFEVFILTHTLNGVSPDDNRMLCILIRVKHRKRDKEREKLLSIIEEKHIRKEQKEGFFVNK